MSNIQIERHNFDVAKNNIKRISNNLPSNPSFTKVEEKIAFGLINRNVTGAEMNDFIDKVQTQLIDFKSSLKELVRGYEEVYKAFDFLDEEYISGIIGSVESAEKASKQALNAQKGITKTTENLEKTVKTLKTKAEELGNLKNTVECIEKTVNEQTSNMLSYDEIVRRLDESYKIGQIPSITDSINSHTIFNESIHESEKLNAHQYMKYERKIKIAYYIGEGAIGLSLINYILQIIGVL